MQSTLINADGAFGESEISGRTFSIFQNEISCFDGSSLNPITSVNSYRYRTNDLSKTNYERMTGQPTV